MTNPANAISPVPESQQVLLARQPILNQEQAVVAFELLFRGPDGAAPGDLNRPEGTLADAATATVILNAFGHLNIDDVVGSKRAYINFTRRILMAPPPLDADRVVLELLEDQIVDAELIAALRNLGRAGFTIALDDFVFDDSLDQLVEVADIVKLEVLNRDEQELRAQVQALRRFDVKLLAEKVEDHQTFELCRSLGFELFQGYFFARPEAMLGRQISASKHTTFQLLAQLQRPNCTPHELAEIIATDSVMSVKLLRLINAAALRRAVRIDSLERAVAMLGTDQLSRWASILSLSQLTDKPTILAITTLVRAVACQHIATASGAVDPGTAFTVGLLSTLDAFFDAPLSALLQELPVAPETVEAILQTTGPAGLILRSVTAIEQGRWAELPFAECSAHGITRQALIDGYAEGMRFANSAEETMR